MGINIGAIKRYKNGLCPECGIKLEYETTCFCPQCGEEWSGDKVLEKYFNPEKENCPITRKRIIDSLSGLP